MKVDLSKFFNSYGGYLSKQPDFSKFGKFVIDSRNAQEGDIFVALKGNNTDGHKFVHEVIDKGVSGVIVEHKMEIEHSFQYVVHSTTDFLIELGAYVRENFKGDFIGITGSSGKTTTKELLGLILSTKFSISKAFANMNTDISLPLFLINDADPDSDFVILELGVQKPGDMDRLLKISKPSEGIILNIGDSHLEYLKDTKGVLKEKIKLAYFVASRGGKVFLNSDDHLLKSYGDKIVPEPIYFGLNGEAHVKGFVEDMSLGHMRMRFEKDLETVDEVFPFSGVNLAMDMLAAVALAAYSGFSLQDAVSPLKTFEPVKGRGNLINLAHNITLVDETYNSNPLSAVVSLEALKSRKDRKLVVILGDMLELGDESISGHAKVGKAILQLRPDILVTYGSFSKEIARIARDGGLENVFSFENRTEIMNFLKELEIFENSIIFVKGSRGMKMEEFVETIIERFRNE
ncbi:MAG: UDP-N-acetylmuramoyl-tripeptide--D-alanyl-D-alanine ligase [Caldisericaceae bacterium]